MVAVSFVIPATECILVEGTFPWNENRDPGLETNSGFYISEKNQTTQHIPISHFRTNWLIHFVLNL